MDSCGARVRGSLERCQLDRDHRGCHSARTFVCDGCGKTRRGTPTAYSQEPEGYSLGYCFLCVKAAGY